MLKSDKIQQLIQQCEKQAVIKIQQSKNNQVEKSHLIRCVMIAIDMTKSMQIKDFKPSRLSVTIHMIKIFIKLAKDLTPIIKIGISIVQQQLCKVLVDFTFEQSKLIQMLDSLKVQENTGFFSLQNTLRTTISKFEMIPSYYRKQLLIIQSSPSTKDYRNIYETIELFKLSNIDINIVSLVGITNIFQKLVEKCHGTYETVTNPDKFQKIIQHISRPMPLKLNKVLTTLVKITWCRKQTSQISIDCFCHMKETNSYYVCGFCNSILCVQPPCQCFICGSILLLPSDLYRFTEEKR